MLTFQHECALQPQIAPLDALQTLHANVMHWQKPLLAALVQVVHHILNVQFASVSAHAIDFQFLLVDEKPHHV